MGLATDESDTEEAEFRLYEMPLSLPSVAYVDAHAGGPATFNLTINPSQKAESSWTYESFYYSTDGGTN